MDKYDKLGHESEDENDTEEISISMSALDHEHFGE